MPKVEDIIMKPKIVRDRIPEIISDSGKKPIYSTVSRDEAVEALEEKLSEELEEYLADHSLEEMADILEVMHMTGGRFIVGLQSRLITHLSVSRMSL